MSTPSSPLLRESIFEYEYLHKYKGKIEKTLHGVGGPWAVSESIVYSKNWVRWTVPLNGYEFSEGAVESVGQQMKQ